MASSTASMPATRGRAAPDSARRRIFRTQLMSSSRVRLEAHHCTFPERHRGEGEESDDRLVVEDDLYPDLVRLGHSPVPSPHVPGAAVRTRETGGAGRAVHRSGVFVQQVRRVDRIAISIRFVDRHALQRAVTEVAADLLYGLHDQVVGIYP